MSILKKKLDTILKEKRLNRHKLCCLTKIADSTLGDMVSRRTPFSKYVKEKILPILEVSEEEFEIWIVADKYSPEVIQKAIEAFKNKEDKKVPVLTQNINKMLKEKNLSQTALSKLIKHSQSALNCAITGKEPLSENLMKKLSEFFEIPEEDLQAWILVDKYSLKILELALKIN
jgi:predicted transcriptional regulator